MNVKELRIGSLVIATKLKTIVALQLSDFAEADFYADHSDSLEWFENHIEPIILNKEWFLKGGFESKQIMIGGDNINDLSEEYSLYGYHFMQDCEGEWFLTGYNWNTKHFKYVHQLQNIFYDLSGEEITFKL